MAIFKQSHLTGQMKEQDFESLLGAPLPGCLTQYRVFPSAGLVKVPHYLTDEEASTLPVAAVTAWMALNTFQPLGSPLKGKETVALIQGTGGVSISALQIAHALQLTSMGTPTSTFGTMLMIISHCNVFIRRKITKGATVRCSLYNQL